MADFVLHYAPVVDRLLPRSLGAKDGGHGPRITDVRGQHFLEGKVAADVAVQPVMDNNSVLGVNGLVARAAE